MNKFKTALKAEQVADNAELADLLKQYPPKVLENKGLAVRNLIVQNTLTGLGGRTIYEFVSDKSVGQTYFEPVLKVGDLVKVEQQPKSGSSKPKNEKENTSIEAVVIKSTSELISVTTDNEEADLSGRLWLVKLVNVATYNRMYWALDKFDQLDTKLAQIARGEKDLSLTIKEADIEMLDPSLNTTQITAVKYAVGSEVSVIHGPPGTGKTSTLIEVARQLVAKGERILICGPSNISVDNIVERLSPHIKGNQLVRLGHPARLLDSVLKHSLDLVSKSSNEGQVIRELQQEIDQTVRKAKSTRNYSERRALWASLKDLRKDYRQREDAVIRNLLLSARVVVATLHTAGSKYLGQAVSFLGAKSLFDTIIIDEVSQALVPQCWIPVVIEPRAARLVIAGDNKQLPPTIKDKNTETRDILEKTLFDILVESHGPSVKHLISVQYRMSQEIMEFPSNEIYAGELTADSTVAGRRLFDLDGVENNDTTESPVVWIDTMGGLFPEQKDEDSLSTKNEAEAGKVVEYVQRLLGSGVQSTDIGVISPYSAQVGLLRQLIPDIEVSTVDGFQGREKEVIVMSLVRSNDAGDVGFVSDMRRINVAITRPKRQLCIVGDSETIGITGFLKNWVEWSQENADIEYADQ